MPSRVSIYIYVFMVEKEAGSINPKTVYEYKSASLW